MFRFFRKKPIKKEETTMINEANPCPLCSVSNVRPCPLCGAQEIKQPDPLPDPVQEELYPFQRESINTMQLKDEPAKSYNATLWDLNEHYKMIAGIIKQFERPLMITDDYDFYDKRLTLLSDHEAFVLDAIKKVISG